jgi:hypothetical protein
MTPSTTFAPTTRAAARRAQARAFGAVIVAMRPMPMLCVVVVPPPSPGLGLPAL